MNKVTKALLIGTGAAAGFFGVTFTVYFFNLDMKLTALMEPIFLNHYDKIKKDSHL
ncbi:MAG: hypothetical protein HUJ78_00595 [Mogibacterium sp.]|nr:hypothetical protein [Mogibacterium sp.]